MPLRHGTDSSLPWDQATFEHPEALLLASDVAACRAFVGMCNGPVGDGGDCAKVDVSQMRVVPFDAGVCYAGTVGTLHESLPVLGACRRTLVRLNIPNLNPIRN